MEFHQHQSLSPIVGGGKMGDLIRVYDWSVNQLGPLHNWPASLVVTVNTLLQSSVPLALLWGPEGIMLYNDAYMVFAGQRHPFIFGSKVLEGWPEVADFSRNILQVVLNGGTLSYQEQQLTLYRNNIAEEVWLNLNYSPILDEEGKPAGVLAIVFETTQGVLAEIERKQMEQALKESEEQLMALVTATSDVIYTMNADWSEMGSLSGRVFVPDVGKPRNDWFESNVPLGEQPIVRKAIEEAIKNRSMFQLEHRIRRADNTIGWTFSRAIPILDKNGEIEKWFGAASDITERKVAEEALQEKNKQLERTNSDLDNFIYTASHDLKAPVSNIEGLLIELKEMYSSKQGLAGDETGLLLEMMENSVNRFKETILDLTDISKANLSNDDVELVSLEEVLQDVKVGIFNEITQSAARIDADFQVANLRFSKKNVKSVVYNLLSNAIKYRQLEKEPHIQISTRQSNGYIVLSISDNGLGMDLERNSKLFSMFKRFHSHVEGTGIGLYIVKRIVDNAGGKIEVESQLEKGTTFRVYFKN